jgi:hypothetical protein
MAKTSSLRDAYRHPGFLPAARVEADSDQPDTFVLPLRRCRKKTSAAVAAASSPVITITSRAEPATSIAAGDRSWWNSSFAASIALGAA